MRAFLLALALCALVPATAGATTYNATPATFASVLAGSANGDTIVLASGSYGSFAGTAKAVTIKADAGASPTMTVDLNTGDSGFTLDGLGGMGGSMVNGVQDVTIKNSTFTSTLQIDGLANANVLLDGNHHDWNAVYSSGGPNSKIFFSYGSATPSGVTIQNSTFKNGNLDGVHTGVAMTVLNSEFSNLCDTGTNHTDNIQFEGATGGRIAGNYVHEPHTGCETQGITSFDGGTNGVTIEDNVVDTQRSDGIEFYSDTNSVIRHNTIRHYATGCSSGACGGIDLDRKAVDPAGTGTHVYDNNANVTFANGSTGTADHNTDPSLVTYAGGSSPTTWAGFELAAGSAGENAASDGLDTGIRVSGPPPPPAQCADGLDNDLDLLIDYPADPGCSSATDNDETDAPVDHQPAAAFSASPEPSVTGQQVTFDGTATTCQDTPCTYRYSDDANNATLGTAQTSTFTFNFTGTKFVRLTVTDADGDANSVEHDHVVNSAPPPDTTPPDTSITSGPSNPTTSTSASFSFTGTDNVGVTGFDCRLDGAAYAACTSPKAYSGLAVGSHTFDVRARDAAGNVDASPATQTWSITTTGVTAPTFVGELENSWDNGSSPKSSQQGYAAGDVIVAYAMSEDSSYTIGATTTPTSTCSLTLRQSVVVSGYGTIYMWTCTMQATGGVTFQFTRSGSGGYFGANVLRFSGSSGVGASSKANASGAPSLGLTTSSANSAVVVASVDWSQLTGARAWRTTAGAFTEQTYSTSTGRYTAYGGYHANVGAAGAKTVGLTAPTGQKYSIAAVEVKGT